MDRILTALQNHFDSCDQCFCEGKLTAKEGGKKFEIKFKNSYTESIWRLKVDNCLIVNSSINKCDFAFYRKIFNAFILVELKGNDVLKGVKQLRSTVELFKEVEGTDINSKWIAFVVPSRVVPATSPAIQKASKVFLKDYGIALKIKNRKATLTLP